MTTKGQVATIGTIIALGAATGSPFLFALFAAIAIMFAIKADSAKPKLAIAK